MSQLITLNLTYNQLGDPFNISYILNCSIPWEIVDLSHNYLTIFPSVLFSLNRFDSVYLNDNHLTTIDLSIIALVQETVDLRNNLITSVVNPTNFNISTNLFTGNTAISLNANTTFDLNDGIYEMYGACEELALGLAGDDNRPPLTLGLGDIDFGAIQVNCSCDQFYIIQMLNNAYGTPVLSPISSLLCSNVQMHFVNYICSLGYSTFNSTNIQPRLCQFDGWNMTTTMTTILATSTTTTTSTVTTTSTSSTSTTSTTTTKTTTSTSTSTTTTSTVTTISTSSTSTTTTTSTKTTTSTSTSTTITSTVTTTSTSSTSTTTTTSTQTTTSTSSTSTTTTVTTTSTSSTSSTTTSTSSTSTTTTTSTQTTTSTSSTSTTTTVTTTSTSSTSSTTTSTTTTTSTQTTTSTSSTSTTTTVTTTSTSSTSSTTTSTTTTVTTTSTSSTSSTTTSTTTTVTTTSTTSTQTTTSTSSTSSTTSSTSTTSTTTTETTTSTSSTSTTSTTTTETTTSTSSTSTTTTTSTQTTTSTSSTSTTSTTTTETTTSTSSTSTTSTTTTETTTSTSSTSTTSTTTTETTTSTSSTSTTSTTTTETTTSTSSTSTTSTTTTETTTSTSSTSTTSTTTTETTSSTSSTSTTSTTTTETTTSTSSTSSTTTSSTATSSTTTVTTSMSVVNMSTCLATFSISDTNLLLTCPSNANLSLLPIDSYDVTTLGRITSLSIIGYNGARGPLQVIPPNICFLTNLQVLNISYNSLDYLDTSFFPTNPFCLETLRTLDMSNNYFSDIPSLFLTQTTNLRRLFLQNNQITSLDLALFVLVSISVDLSNNQISKITNNANVNISNYTYSLEASIDLTNNSQIIDLTDVIYEMYGACYEIYQIFNNSIPTRPSLLTIGFLNINFGTSKINCNCNQYYIQQSFIYAIGDSVSSAYPLSNALCTDGNLFYNNNKTAACSASSANFTNITPRLCQINPNDGNINFINTTTNITGGIYPYYLTQTVNNSYCLFTFYTGGKRVSIDCVNGSNLLTEITSSILNNIYFRNITQVSINNQNSFSQLPIYLCTLPSTSIDLSNQSFVILDQNTFPCSASSTLETINLAYNKIIIVNLTLSNWILIDLTANNLTQFPYTLVNSNIVLTRQLTQRTLLLPFNQITQFDLFIYTYANTIINLQNNPFSKTTNGYNILNNYQQQSLRSEPVSTSVILPSQMRFLLNDPIAQNYGTCDSQSLNYLLDIFQRMQTDNITVEIQCDCSTIYIKEYFGLINSTGILTNQFPCSSISSLSQTQFESLTETDCLSNIALSSSRLCQFASIQTSTLSSSPSSNDNGRSLAIILSSVLGSLGFVVLLALLIAFICYKRKSSKKPTEASTTLARVPYTKNTHPIVRRPYFLSQTMSPQSESTTTPGSSNLIGSIDLSQQGTNYRQKQRRPKEPPIDYDSDPRVFRITNPTRKSSHV